MDDYRNHNRAWWDELDRSIKKFVARDACGVKADTIREIQDWSRQAILTQRKLPTVQPLLRPPFRPDLTPGEAAPYLARVLNEWLPAEVARVLTGEAEFGGPMESGIPAVTVAIAL